MPVESLAIAQRSPFAHRAAKAIAYEAVRGVATFAVDPAANERIVDLDLASADADGSVRFDADFVIVQPIDPVQSCGRLLYVVPNRGRIGTLPFSTRTLPMAAGAIDPGDGLLLESGWAIAYSGWQWDIAEPAALGLRAPEALINGRPLEGTVRVDFRPEVRCADHRLADSTGDAPFATYTAADLDQRDAVLTVRESVSGPGQTIPRDRWRFAREANGAVVADSDSIWLEGGFEPYLLYEVRYRTCRSPVVGTGLLAVRDFVSCLRGRDQVPSPLGRRIEHAFATGNSQTGRFLRHFVFEGMNLDDAGEVVFDGMLPHIAGARRGEFNERFGQPSHIGYTGHSTSPPYSPDEREGLFDLQRRLGGVPKTIATNTSWEYWRSDAALNHIDPATGEDRAASDEVRYFLFSGIDHLGASPQKRDLALANPPNPLGGELLLRAAFANLVAWVCDGTPPPDSRVPRRADGTAVDREEVLAAFAKLPGVVLPDAELLPLTASPDVTQPMADALGRPDAAALRCFVSSLDATLNEAAGVRLPELAVPVATYTGWNCPPRLKTLREFCGAAFALPLSPSGADPRPPLTLGREAYAAEVEQVAAALVAERLLLAADVDLAVARALERFDVARATAGPQRPGAR